MSFSRPIGRSFTPGALLALAFVAGCNDSGVLMPSEVPAVSFDVSLLATPLPADVVVPGVTVGSFGAFVANNSGRATTEFWDNLSADIVNGVTLNCNVGFFATGAMGAACLNQTAGSLANQGGGYNQYWRDGVGDPSAFMFNGDHSYDVTLKGAYHGSPSVVGWFTKTAGVYTLHPFASLAINSTTTINTGGLDWGFYVNNNFNVAAGGCVPPDTDCSDAEGGFGAAQFQQFALFLNSATNTYLVGLEDNKLELFPNNGTTFLDSDYNDYMFSVTATILAEGCTLTQGYWKTHASGKKDAWPVQTLTIGGILYTKAELVAIMEAPTAGNGVMSLVQQLIAAKLNVLNGASNAAIAQAIIDADTMIDGAGGKIVPPYTAPTSPHLDPSVTSALNNTLTAWNEGTTGPGHCDD